MEYFIDREDERIKDQEQGHSLFSSAMDALSLCEFDNAAKLFRRVLLAHDMHPFLSEEEVLIAKEGLGIALMNDELEQDEGIKQLEDVTRSLYKLKGPIDIVMLSSLNALTEAHVLVSDYQKAIKIFKEEIRLLENRNDTEEEILSVRFEIAETHQKAGMLDIAITELNDLLSHPLDNHMKGSVYTTLAKCYFALD